MEKIPTPCYVCEEALLERNLKILDRVQSESLAKILLALKGFAMVSTFKLIKKYLYGACASGLWEAKLAREEIDREVHTFSVAFKDDEIDEIIDISDDIIFNSFNQLKKYKEKVLRKGKKVGIRVNPKYSEIETDIYNPCIVGSRLGVTPEVFQRELSENPNILDGVSGLHFHTHCEQNSDSLSRTLPHFEKHFGKYLNQMSWVNFGGGHHITRADYDIELLIQTISNFKEQYPNLKEIYLEPGEAIGWQVGFLISTVVDIVENGVKIAILDVSVSNHMPDCLEMPYRPDIRGSALPNQKRYNYRVAGPTCLAGDVVGDYSFDRELKVGDRLIFEDMIHYTFVKNTTFNGIKLPSLGILKPDGEFELIKEFNYLDYKSRL